MQVKWSFRIFEIILRYVYFYLSHKIKYMSFVFKKCHYLSFVDFLLITEPV